MIRRIWGAGAAVLILMLFCCGMAAGEGGDQEIIDLSSQPVQFIENAGQAPEEVMYQVKSLQFSFDFTTDGMRLYGASEECPECEGENLSPVLVTLDGASSDTRIEAVDQLEGYANFLIGNNASEWQTEVPWFGSIRYVDILPGINLTYTGKTGVLKREFLLQPGAEPSSIILRYDGAKEIFLEDDGSLSVNTSFGNLTEAAPLSYQDINGTILNVPSSYVIREDGLVGYEIGDYNPEYPLVIDPYLEYSTYLGGTLEDFGMDIAVDSSGNAYVTGYTSSCNFPVYPVTGYFNPTAPYRFNGSYCHSSSDIYVTKISSVSGGNATIQFSTYLGGTKGDFGRGIAVDSGGNMYVTGDTWSDDFPTVLPTYVGDRLRGQNDAFISKIRSDGTNFVYSTYMGGTNNDIAYDIAVDSLFSAYITGQTVGNSPYKDPEDNFPTTSGAYQTEPNPDATMGDAFVTKLGPIGNTIEYSSYISGSNQDIGNGIAVDGQKCAYITGTTSSSNLLPSGVPGYDLVINGIQDAFLFKMDFAATNPVVYATYLGGSTGYDYGEAVAVDSAFSAYLTGSTASTDFPTTTYAFSRTKGWPYNYFEKDAYVTKFSSDGTGLEYSTYLGGSEDDWGYDIAVDDTGRAFVTGYTKSQNLKVKDDIKRYAGGQDAFVACMNNQGSNVVYLTYLGGYRDDVGRGIAVNGDGTATYVTGYTTSPSYLALQSGINCDTECFPVLRWINQQVLRDSSPSTYVGGNFSGDYQGSYDSFVVKFGSTSLTPSFTPNQTCGEVPLTVLFTDNSGTDPNIVLRQWDFGDGNTTTTGSVAENVLHTYNGTGVYPATLTLYTYTSIVSSDPSYITVCSANRTVNFTAVGYNSTGTPITVPINIPVTFAGAAANYTPTLWDWYFGDGTANQTGQSVVHQYTSNGTYTATLTGTSCCGNLSIQRQIAAIGPPYVDFAATSSRFICQGGVVNFTAVPQVNAIYGPPSQYEWNFGDSRPNVTTTSTDVDHQFDRAGNFTITLTASNVAGSYTYQRVAYVGVSGNATAFFNPDPATGVNPLLVNFTDQSTGSPTDWRWDFGDGGSVSHVRNTTHTYTSIGEFRANLTVWSCDGTPTFWNRTITVNGNISPTMILKNASLPVWNDPSVPVNGSNASPFQVFFLGNTSDGSLIDEAWWDFGDGSAEVHQERIGAIWPADNNTWFNTSHNYTATGDYTPVIRIINNTFGSATSGELYYHYVGVYGPMILDFSITDLIGTLLPGTPQQGLVGVPVQFHDLSTGGGGAGNWSWHIFDVIPGPGTIVTGIPDPIFTFTTSGNKWVTLAVENKYGAFAGVVTKNLTMVSPTTTGTVQISPDNITLIKGTENWRRVNITLDRADYGIRSYRVGLDLNSTAATNFGSGIPLTEKPLWVDEFNADPIPSTGAIQYLTLSGLKLSGSLPFGSTNVSLGNVTLFGTAAGNAAISINGSSNAENGTYSMNLLGSTAQVHVYEVTTLPGETNPPQDTDHNGLIDDFNGNGRIEFDDVTTFFAAVSSGALTSPVPPYDYDQNGVINTNDIVTFYDRYW